MRQANVSFPVETINLSAALGSPKLLNLSALVLAERLIVGLLPLGSASLAIDIPLSADIVEI